MGKHLTADPSGAAPLHEEVVGSRNALESCDESVNDSVVEPEVGEVDDDDDAPVVVVPGSVVASLPKPLGPCPVPLGPVMTPAAG